MRAATAKPPFLLIAHYYPPHAASGAARPHRIAKYLGRLGHDVTVVSGARKRELKPGPDGKVYRLRTEDYDLSERDLPVYIEYLFHRFLFPHDPGIGWAFRCAAKAGMLGRKLPNRVVLSTAPPLTVHIAALWLKLRYGWPWIADFRDPLVGNPCRKAAITTRTDPWWERQVFRYADALIANTDAVAKVWRDRFPEYANKIHVVWNGFDPEDMISALPLPAGQPKTLAHVGSIYADRDPLAIINAIQDLIRTGTLDSRSFSVKLFGPTKTDSMPVLEKLVREQSWLDLRNEFIPKQEATVITQTSDYLLLLDMLGPEAGLQVPAKLFEYILIGRPVLASTTPGSPVSGILERSGIPHFCYYGETDADSRSRLAWFFSLPPHPVPASRWFLDTFNAMNQAEYISSIAETIIGGRTISGLPL